MPHKCARCERMYSDNAPELIKGCGCGSRVFLFIKKREESEEEAFERLRRQKIEVEDLDWIENKISTENKKGEGTIRLDIENLLRVSKGKYRLNIASLMRGDPLVIKVREGVYYIDLPYSMKKKGG